MSTLTRLVSPASWLGRTTILACIILLPFVGFLAGDGYPLLTPEALAGIALLWIVCACLAFCFRGLAFRGIFIVAVCVIAAVPLQREASRWAAIPLAVTIVALASVSAGLMALLHGRFYQVLATFSLGMLAAHLAPILLPAGAPRMAPEKPAHVLRLILDEHMGPAGLPPEIAACRHAADTIRTTFGNAGFELFPYAYSNYATTLDSVPSLLNRVLLPHRHALLQQPAPDLRGVFHANTSKFLDEYRARGLAVRLVQYRNIDFSNGRGALVTQYPGSLAHLARAPGSWIDRFRLVIGHYQASNAVLARFRGFFPFRCGLRMVLPISAEAIWPDGLITEITAAAKPTLFLAHILSPHGPYVYRPDGSLRDIRVWARDEDYERLNRQDYEERYTRYAEQVEYVQSQLGRLFDELRRAGLLDQMCVVVHGDHGSRILLQRPGLKPTRVHGPAGVDRYDYDTAPDPQDLRDRFSVLLAIKLPGRQAATINSDKGSAQRFLSERLYGQEIVRPSPVDSAFLFDAQGKPREIRMDNLWDH